MTVRPPTSRGKTVNKFKGISLLGSAAVVPPDYALDLLNVLPSNGGFIEKVRIPTELCDIGTGHGPSSMDDFQQATGVRQILAGADTKLFYITIPDYVVVPIDDQPEYGLNIWSMIELDNVMYITNGEICLKWIGTALQLWGIDRPTVAPVVQQIFNMVQVTKPGAGATPFKCTIVGVGAGECPVRVGQSVTFAGMAVLAGPDENGTHVVTVVNLDGTFGFADIPAGVDSTCTGGTMIIVGTNTIVVSCGYAYTYKNSALGGESNVSEMTVATPVVNGTVIATAEPSLDNQVDTICWFKTLDGGTDLFLIGEFLISAGGLILNDPNPPLSVDQSQFAPLYNAPPLNGRYSTAWQGRVFIGNITGAPQDIIYSAYERIFRGRPPECFPEFNRLRLAIGADDIRGIGVIQAGVVAFSRSNEMYMLRGVVEDIVTSAPVAFSAFLEQLPWQLGVSSHWSIQSTTHGLLFLGSDFNPYNFNGTAEPLSLAPGLAPLLTRITTAQNENIRSTYFSYADRDWYVLLVPVNGSATLNRIVFIDMTEEPAVNIGAFICDIVAEAVAVIEDGSGGRKMVISREGVLYEFKALSDAINGLVPAGEITEGADPDAVLTAYWRSGYFGGDAPEIDKMFRYLQLLTSIGGFGVILRIVEGNDIANPEILGLQEVIDGYADISWKAKRVSVEIQFPQADVDCSVLELVVNVIYLASRPSGGAS